MATLRYEFTAFVNAGSNFVVIRHEFYETDERVTLSVFDKSADPAQVVVNFEPRKVGDLIRIVAHPYANDGFSSRIKTGTKNSPWNRSRVKSTPRRANSR